MEEGTVKFLINPNNNNVTRIIVQGADSFLLDDLMRYSGCKMMSGKKGGEFYPAKKMILKDIAEDHKFYSEGLGVEISIEPDKKFLLSNDIIRFLEDNLPFVNDNRRDDLAALMHYSKDVGWSGCCEYCGKIISATELLRNLSTLCTECIKEG
ncbi:MAG: hypothetical protein RBS86_04380 [Candidatus Moranbacteria bacterium]|jgi:hypothetical protein|nr:hypothetical protein [Candidatus Moranbacteria bacterium]